MLKRIVDLARANITDFVLRRTGGGSKSADEDPASERKREIDPDLDDYVFRRTGGTYRESDPAPDPLAELYANLEVPVGSDLETVKASWKRLLKKYHPDLHSSDPEKRKTAAELTARLNEAYQKLEKAGRAPGRRGAGAN